MAGVKQFTIFTKFAVKNGFSGPVLNMAKGADKLAARADKAMKVAGKMGKGFATVGKYAAIGAGAAVAAGAAVWKLADGSQQAADDIQNTANALGLTTDALQQYRYVGIQAGLTTEDMDSALRKLTVNLGKDSGDVENALYQIGLTAEQLKAAGPDKSLEMVANGFQTLQDPAKKAAVATALFGKSSVRMVNALEGGAKGIEKTRKEAVKIGYVMGGNTLDNAGDLNHELDKLGATAIGLRNRLAAKAIPGLTKFVKSLQAGIQPGGRLSNMLDGMGKLGGKVADSMGPLLDKLLNSGGDIFSGIGDSIAKIAEVAGPALMDIIGELPKLLAFIPKILTALQPVLKPLLEMIKPIIQIFENLMPAINAILGVISAVLAPFLETIKFILQATAALTGNKEAQAALTGGLAAPKGAVPVSPQTGMVSSTSSTSRSVVDLNIGPMPSGSSVKQTGKAPGVTLNTGKTATPGARR